MSAPPTLKPNAQILNEASAWFVEFSEGEVSLTGRQAFSDWLKASPEHVRAYLAISATFDGLDQLGKSRSGDAAVLVRQSLADNTVFAWQSHAERPTLSGCAGRAPNWRARAILVAAPLVLAAVALGAWRLWFSGGYSTGTGEQRIVNLADGSTIELNAESRIRVRLGDHERDVDLLEGQALFHVAKDATRPFIVKSDGTTVRAVGTQFDVDREAGDTVVTVLEGRVAVAHTREGNDASSGSSDGGHLNNAVSPTADQPLYLSAGEQAILTAQMTSKPAHPDVVAATAWRERKLIFSSSPLSQVITEYNRYHEKRLVLADSTLAGFRISGVFSAADSTSLIAFLRAQSNIAVDEEGSRIILRAR